MFEEIEFPKTGWRPPRGPKAKRELRGARVAFTHAQQAQYDQLVSTVKSGRAVLVPCEYTGKGELAAASRKSVMDIDSAVRIRLLDKEGYAMETKRADAKHVAVRLHEEELRCSSLGCRINVVEWQREHPGVRLRRTDPCPYHTTHGVLIPPKKQEVA